MIIDASEIRKPIVGFEGTYEVSILEIRRVAGGRGARAGRILKQFLDSYGYLCVHLYLRGKRTTRRVSTLIADAFLPAKGPTDTVVRHINDIKTDNRVCNLAWGTYSDNMADSIRNGKHVAPGSPGAANGRAKLTEDNVREIRRLYATGQFTQQDLALKFGVAQSVISDIVKRRKWKHVV